MAKAKSNKTRQRSVSQRSEEVQGAATVASASKAFSPPTKKPSLLATSIVLFGLWFVYLLVVALGG